MLSLLDVRQVPINARFGTLAQKGSYQETVVGDCIGVRRYSSGNLPLKVLLVDQRQAVEC